MGKRRKGNTRGMPFHLYDQRTKELATARGLSAANDEAADGVALIEKPRPTFPEPMASADAVREDLAAVTQPHEVNVSLSPQTDQLTASYTSTKTQSWLLSFFSAPSPLRLETLSFIASIEENTRQLHNADQLFIAACLHVMLVIKEPYLNAWFFNDPKGSDMFTILTEKVGEKTDEEQLDFLKALNDYLQDGAIQEKIKFGGQTAAVVLSGIAAQIESLKEKTAAPIAAAV
jgi:hypothetical protein